VRLLTRYAWNDATNLPDWFLDDEAKNYRPQIPIAKELQERMKEKFKSLASKPIAKVAEARARKRQVSSVQCGDNPTARVLNYTRD
jgi:AdoMet-dependent rRNA methyltransferase SPB1